MKKIESCFDFFAKQKSKFSLFDFTQSRERGRERKRERKRDREREKERERGKKEREGERKKMLLEDG